VKRTNVTSLRDLRNFSMTGNIKQFSIFLCLLELYNCCSRWSSSLQGNELKEVGKKAFFSFSAVPVTGLNCKEMNESFISFESFVNDAPEESKERGEEVQVGSSFKRFFSLLCSLVVSNPMSN
jgi:hypothetical protein